MWFSILLEGSLKVIVVCSYFFLPCREVDTVPPVFLFSVLYQAASPAVVLKSLRWSRRNHRRPPAPQKPHPRRSNRHAKPRSNLFHAKAMIPSYSKFQFGLHELQMPGLACRYLSTACRLFTAEHLERNGKIKQEAYGAPDFA